MGRTEWKFQEVRDAVTAFLGEFPADASYFEVLPVYADVMGRLGLDLITPQNVGGYAVELTRERDRLWSQVRRALDELSGSQGVLVKVGRGQYHPSGSSETGATYYPVLNYERAVTKARDAFRERTAVASAWADVHVRLGDLGFVVHSLKGQPVTLDLDGWQRLLAIVETGQYVEPGCDPLS